MSRLFGWSYPPGVSSLPWDREMQCEVCGEYESKCICPECPVCGEVGDPDCYKTRLVKNYRGDDEEAPPHLILSLEQDESLAWCMNRDYDEARAEDEWLNKE